MNLNLLVLRCADIEASQQFYQRLGFSFVQEQHGQGPRHYAAMVGGVVLELYPASANFPADRCRLGLNVADVAALAAVFGETVGERDGKPLLLLKDPDGRTVETLENPP